MEGIRRNEEKDKGESERGGRKGSYTLSYGKGEEKKSRSRKEWKSKWGSEKEKKERKWDRTDKMNREREKRRVEEWVSGQKE